MAGEYVRKGRVRVSRMGRRRAWVLLGVHVVLGAHLLHWQLSGESLSPLEPSEALYTTARGVINAGLMLLGLSLVATLILGRFFCGWGCHVVALQDICAWLLKKVGLRPKPIRSRLLSWVPLLAGLYMFLGPLMVRVVRDWRGAPNEPWRAHLELTKTDLWETFPGPWLATITFLLCGFVIVYLLGAKGFCAYACPYGGLFGLVDRLAPARIRVTDACSGCGHCSAVCTSNVLVAKEVHEHGMVVDPGCMKCLDCVSVCPEGALYWGFGRPAALAKPRVRHKKPRPWSLGRGEELLGVAIFTVTLLVFSGLPKDLIAGFDMESLYGGTPLLLSLGLSAMTAFLAIWMLRLLLRADVRFQNHVLRESGRLRRAGAVFLVSAGLWLLIVAHSALVQALRLQSQARFDALVTPELDLAIWRQDRPRLEALRATRGGEIDACRSALELARRVAVLRRWRYGEQLAWLDLLDLDPGRAEQRFARASEAAPAGARGPLQWGRYSAFKVQGRMPEARRALEAAVADQPDHETYRFELAALLSATGRPAEALPHLRHVIDLGGPGADRARLVLAQILVALGRAGEALPLVDAVLEGHPREGAVLVTRIQVLEALGRGEEAQRVRELLRRLGQ